MDLEDVGLKGVLDWVHSAQYNGWYGRYMNRVMNAGNFLSSGAFQDSLLHGLV